MTQRGIQVSREGDRNRYGNIINILKIGQYCRGIFKELASRRKEESIVDLEMDFIAPYLQKYPDINSLTKAQALEVFQLINHPTITNLIL